MSADSYTPIVAASTARCPETAMPCDNTTKLFCENGGVCCQRMMPAVEFCACPQGYKGDECEINMIFEILESRDRTMAMISLSSAISIAVGLIALIALGIITFVIVRSSRKRRYWGLEPVDPEKDLDKTIVFVQEEISKLSTVQQLHKLRRLSKLFEKTVQEAILSEPGNRVERLTSVAMNEYLPRWSSAPTCIDRPPNDLDVIDGPDFQKTKLQQVFSVQ